MGKPCPRCKSSNTIAKAPQVMWCKDCAHSWRPNNSTKKSVKKTKNEKDKPFNIMEDTILPKGLRTDF
jgi:hypothetical protein